MAAEGRTGTLDIKKLEELFNGTDVTKDGSLGSEELLELFKKKGNNLTGGQLKEVFEFFDGPTQDMRITFENFCMGLDVISKEVKLLEELFKQVDINGDGYLDKNEIKNILKQSGKDYSDQEMDDIVKEADKNGDNKICLKEFLDACTCNLASFVKEYTL